MIKNVLSCTTILTLTLSSSFAFSEVLSSTKVSVPPMKWAGFYAGLNAGGVWSQDSNISILSSFVQGSQTPLTPDGATYTAIQSARSASGVVSSNDGGFIGGAQIGYNWQGKGPWLGGFGVDFQGIVSGHSNGQTWSVVPLVGSFDQGATQYSPGEFFESSLKSNKRTDYLGTVRGRLGKLATPTLLLQGTGGFAYGGVSSSASINQTNNDSLMSLPAASLVPRTLSTGSYSNTLFGWTAGADAEWMFKSNWSAKVEYLYYDLGRVSYAVDATALRVPVIANPIAMVATQVSTRFNGNIIRVGINHHFNL